MLYDKSNQSIVHNHLTNNGLMSLSFYIFLLLYIYNTYRSIALSNVLYMIRQAQFKLESSNLEQLEAEVRQEEPGLDEDQVQEELRTYSTVWTRTHDVLSDQEADLFRCVSLVYYIHVYTYPIFMYILTRLYSCNTHIQLDL